MRRPIALSSWCSLARSNWLRIIRVQPRWLTEIYRRVALVLFCVVVCTIAASAQCSLTSTPAALTEVGVSYSQDNTASGCTAPLTFSLAGGALPGGTTLNPSTGTVSGIPTTQGFFSYTIQVTDGGAAIAQAASSGTIAPALTLTPTPSANTEVGVAYSQTNTVSGGTGPYAYSLAAGSLPAGTTLDPSSGTVSGIPTTAGAFDYTIRVTDGASAFAQSQSSGMIAPALSLTSSPSANAQVGQSYSQTNVASGGTTPYVYSLASGTLPAGTSLDTSTGTVSGTPTAAGPFNYTIKITDAAAAFAQASSSGTIAPGPLAITPTASTITQVGQSYSQTNVASGGTGPYVYSLTSGSLPAGTSLDTSNGTVSGTPTTQGFFSYTIRVTDGASAFAQASSSGTIAPALTLTSTPSANAQVGQAYSQTNVASGGTTPYVYSLASGTLPAGTSLDTSTGTVSGTPTAAGPFNYTIKVTDAAAAFAQASSSGTIAPGPLAITPTASTITQVGQSYSQINVASGGTTPYVYSLTSGSLPAGTALDTSTGTVSGTPTTAGPFSYAIKVTDGATAFAQASTSGTIAPAALAITPTASTATQIGQSYSQTNAASGGTTPYVYSLASGSLPAGTSLDTSTGTVSGTPTTAGPFSYAIKVTDTASAMAQASSSGTIAATTTTISLSSSVNPSVPGQSVTFTATVSGGSSPSGTVTFRDGGSLIGTASLSGTIATFTTSSLALGNHAITAAYSGNASNAASSSAVLQQSVAVPADSIRLRQMQILGTRQSAQLSGQNITGAVGNAIDNAFSGSVQAVTPNGSGFTYNFVAEDPAASQTSNRQTGGSAADSGANNVATAPDRTTSRLVEEAFSALGDARIARAPPKAAPPDWLAWIDVRGISFSNRTPGTDLSGNQVNVTAGLTRRLADDFVVGGFGGFEHLNFNSDALNSRLKGDGWTVGGYLGWRLAPNMRFDMMLGRSAIGYNDTAGMASANFRGMRWLASGGVTGTYDVQGFVLQPSAKLYALWERDGAYVDSLGIAQPSYSFSTGRASAGTRVSYPFEWSPATMLAPYAAVHGDYYFTGNQASVAGVPTIPLLLQGWSARVAAGLDMTFGNGGTIGLGGELGGIGSSASVLTYTYRVRGSVPF